MADNDAPSGGLERYDILPKMLPYFDRHLIYPIINDMEDGPEATKLKYELLKETNMTDFVGGLEKEVKGLSEVPKEYERKRDQVVKKRNQLEDATTKIRDLLSDPDVISNIRSDKAANMKYLKEEHAVTEDMVSALYEYGQFQYSCGDYADAAELLYRFRILSADADKGNAATWGKLASEILTTEWDTAMEEISKVKDSIESRLYSNSYAQLQSRTWLIHWSLFPLFNHEPSRDIITDLYFSAPFINTIQTLCPWILRYLTAAVVTNRGRSKLSNLYQKQLKDLIRIVKQEGYEYSDPLTDFIRALYVEFDFEEAQKNLSDAEALLREDYFLHSHADNFVEAARHLISESYCKIHQRIDIKDLSTRLGLSESEGEKWIVNLIRDTRVDAKIDYQAGTVEMNHPPQSVYQQVIERTKGAFFRTQVLSAAVAK